MISRAWALILSTLVLILSFLTSCHRSVRYPAELYVADSLAMCNADRAVAYLDSLAPAMEQATEPTLRYYQLLTIKARDKAFLPHPSDSLILTVLHYYEQGGDPRLLPEAYYYAGRVTRDLGDAPQAVDYFHAALDAIEDEDYEKYRQEDEFGTNRLKGRIHAQTAYLLALQHLYNEAIEEYQMAATCDSLNRDSAFLIKDYREIGYDLSRSGKYDEALTYFHLSQEVAEQIGDSTSFANAVYQEAYTLLKQGKLSEAKELVNQYPLLIKRQNQNFITSLLARKYSLEKDYGKAALYYSKIKDNGDLNDRSNAYIWLAKYAQKTLVLDSAIYFLNEAIITNDSLIRLQNDDAVAYSSSVYNYQLRVKENEKLKRQEKKTERKHTLWGFGTILSLVIIGFVGYIEYKKRKTLHSECQRLSELLELKDREAEESKVARRNAMAQLRTSKAMTLIEEKLVIGDNLSEQDWEEIEETFKRLLPDFLINLRSFHHYTEPEWRLCLLSKMELKAEAIGTLICLSQSAIYNKSRRLYKKIFGHECSQQEWDKFIKSL